MRACLPPCGRLQRFHAMLEAQLREGGGKLSDLDKDAQELLKSIEPPCREAAVKVSSESSQLRGLVSSIEV